MKIVVDVDCLYTAQTGVRTYVQETVSALKELGHDVIELKRNPSSLTVRLQSRYRGFLHLGRFVWTQLVLPIKLGTYRPDLLISPEYFTPIFSPVPNYVTVHEAVFLRRQQDYSRLFRAMFKLVWVPSILRSTRVLAVSEFSKREIGEWLKLTSDRIGVTYLGAKRFSEYVESDSSMNGTRYFLHVGVLEKRKNIVRVLEAFSQIREDHDNLHFYIVGSPPASTGIDDSFNISRTIERLNLGDAVKFFGYVSDATLQALYSHAIALVFPSLYEGFGLPIVEAFNSCIPVITAKGGATEEIAGDAALLCDPLSVEEIHLAMVRLNQDSKLRTELICRGLERAKKFTWDRTAQTMIDFLYE